MQSVFYSVYNKKIWFYDALLMQQTANILAESSGGVQSGKNGFIT